MNIEKFLPIMNNLLPISEIILCIFSLVMIVTYILSLWFIFKKEEIKEFYSLIPFYNFYLVFKIAKIPFYTIFIPFVNVIVMILLPYKLLNRYKRPRWMMNLSIVFPYAFMLYIAFSDKCKKPKDIRKAIKTLFELENIENNLESNLDIDDLYFREETQDINNINSINNNFVSKTEEMIQNIEENSIIDDYYLENEIVDEELESKKNNDIPIIEDNIEDIIEIFDQEENSLLSSGIDSIEDQLKNNDNIVHVDTAKYEQYKQKEASNESIAFGGTKKEENSTHNKSEDLKCQRCGSSLIGANDYCPGCGLKIS